MSNILIVLASLIVTACLVFVQGCATSPNPPEKNENNIFTIIVPEESNSAGENNSKSKEAKEWVNKSSDSLVQKNWAEAIRASSVAIDLDHRLYGAYINRSWAYTEKGFYANAIADAKKAITINPESGLAYNNLGFAYQRKGDQLSAMENYKTACDKDLHLACENYKKLTGFSPSEIQGKIKILLDESLQEFQKENWDEVVVLSSWVLVLDKDNSRALSNKASALAEKGMLDEALDVITYATKVNPNNGIAYHNKGYILELMHRDKEAALQYEIACGLGIEQSCLDLGNLSTKQ
ncbi:tetratricopeptide repeat protein [Kaarinaea lacus]